MEEKTKSLILDYYHSLASEPRGTMSRFVTWLAANTGISQTAVVLRLKSDRWNPIERAFIMEGIRTGSWRESLGQQVRATTV